jgi:hypothetical protein
MVDGQMPDLGRFMTAHREAAARARLVAIALAALGVLLLLLGLAPLGLPAWVFLLAGLVVAACAAFPAREYLEHRDRISGLEVLQDEWRELQASGAADPAEVERLRVLVARLYPRNAAG